jgi:putative acetyltransferase
MAIFESISIRRTEPADAGALVKIFESESVYAQTLQLPYPSHKSWSERLSATPDNVHSFVAEVEEVVVGNISVAVETRPRRRHVALLGMAVHAEYSGGGIGRSMLAHAVDFCDGWLGIRRIELTVFSDNERAINLYRQFNFMCEGEAQGYALRNGRYENVLYMARVSGQ